MARSERLRDYLSPEGSKRKEKTGIRAALMMVLILMGIGGAMAGAVLLLTTTVDLGNRGAGVVDGSTLRTGSLELKDAFLQVNDEGDQALILLVEPARGQEVNVSLLRLRFAVRNGEAIFQHGVADQPNKFTTKVVRDEDGSMARGIARDADLLELRFDLTRSGLQFASRDTAKLEQVAFTDEGTELVATYSLVGPRSLQAGLHRLEYS